MDDTPAFGPWLKRRRQALHFTQQQLGEMASCAAETIRKYEIEERRPSVDIARLLAIALQIPEAEHATFVRFARGERASAPLVPTVEVQVRPRALQSPSNLPVPLTSIIGRDAEMAQVCTLLVRNDARLVTLTGPGGVGKTCLSLAVAGRLRDAFADGIWFVDLVPISDPELVLATIAQTLGVPETLGEQLLATVLAHLRDRQQLLILDNFEQILAAGTVVGDLLRGAPGLTVLVTSRAPLHLRGEHEIAIHPLPLPRSDVRDMEALSQYDTVRLFIERAQAVQADFQVTNATAPAVAEICTRLDGLPLAIELAAARVKLLPPDALLARLNKRLRVLTGGPRDLPARQQTIRNAIAWSYDLLDQPDRQLFARVGVFVGGWTLDAVEGVCGGTDDLQRDVLDGLQSLLEKSLVRQVAPSGEPRFTMLETVREYALEQLQASGEEHALRQRHAAYYLDVAEAAEPELRGPRQRLWLDRLEAEHDNLRAALAWSQAAGDGQATGLRLVAALRWFWFCRGYLSEGRHWLDTMLDMEAGPSSTGVPSHAHARARALGGAATLAWQQADYQMARLQRVEAVSIWRTLGDMSGLADELHHLGHLTLDQQDYLAASSAFDESLALYRTLGNDFMIHALIGDLGMVAYHQGSYAIAGPLLEESVTGLRKHGPTDILGDQLNRMGDLARLAGDVPRAVQLYDESLALFRAMQGTLGIASALHKLGSVAQHQGEYQRARTLFAESLGLQQQMGNKQGIAECLVGLAVVQAGMGSQGALRLLAAASSTLAALDVPLAPADRIDFDWALAAAHRVSDDEAWAAACAEGHAMTLEQAIADALVGMEQHVPMERSAEAQH